MFDSLPENKLIGYSQGPKPRMKHIETNIITEELGH
jgi:hypothetical protein